LSKIYKRCEQWTQKHKSKFAKRKHKLIYFTRISKRYNIIVDVTLANYEVEVKQDIKILEVQLNNKSQFRSHLRQIETKLVIKQRASQIIIKSTWNLSLATKKHIYLTISKSMLSHKTIAWYTSTKLKEDKKTITTKLRSIQEQALR